MKSVLYSVQNPDWLAVKLFSGISLDIKGISFILQQSLTPAVQQRLNTLDKNVLQKPLLPFVSSSSMFDSTTLHLTSNELALYVFVNECIGEITPQSICQIADPSTALLSGQRTKWEFAYKPLHILVETIRRRQRWTLDTPAHTNTLPSNSVCCRVDYISHLLLPGVLTGPHNEMAAHINHAVVSPGPEKRNEN